MAEGDRSAFTRDRGQGSLEEVEEGRVVDVVVSHQLGLKTDLPSTAEETDTARSGISLLKGIKNYLRTMASGVAAANPLVPVAATIADDASLSAEVDLGAGRVLCAIDMPADWTAANLTFQASYNTGGTFDNLYDQYGTEKTVIAAEDRYIPLDNPAFWMGVRYLKVRSGTAAAPVVQDRVGGTTLQLITKPV